MMKHDINSNRASQVPEVVDGQPYLPSVELRPETDHWTPDKVHLKEYLAVAMRRKWQVTTFFLLVFISVLALTLFQTRQYTASATMEIGPRNQNVTKFKDVETSDLRASEYYDTQVQLIQSREVVRRVVEELKLGSHPVVIESVFGTGDPGFEDRIKKVIESLSLLLRSDLRPSLQSETGTDVDTNRQQALLRFVADGLNVSSRRTAMLIDISFTSPDPHLSRDVANGVSEAFIHWKMDKKLAASKLARKYLNEQIDQARANLEKAEASMNLFAEETHIVSMDAKSNSVLGQLEKLNETLAMAKSDLIEKEADYYQAKKDGPSALPEVMESPLIGQLKADYAKNQAEYERMREIFSDGYPSVRSLVKRMNSIKERIRKEEQKMFRSIQHRYESAQAKVGQMEKRLSDQQQLTMDLNKRATRYAIVEREVETNKQIYLSLLERSREIESLSGITSSNIHLVDEAILPLKPSSPNVRRNLLSALLLGVVGGLGMAFFMEYYTDRVSNPDEIEDRYQIPILGFVPLVGKIGVPLGKAFVEAPRAPFSEAIRTTRVSIQLSEEGGKSRSFVITSTKPGEGKTTLAANLALTFAGSGEKVVVVDADMRRPTIHNVFNVSNDPISGLVLSSFLAGDTKNRQPQSNGVGHLHLVTAGPIPPNPVELLTSHRFGKLMTMLARTYDRVIVDGPPMQGIADVLILSRHVDGVVLVNSMGEASRESLRHFKKSMMTVDGHVLGCIINKVDHAKRYGYQSYYNYYDPT